MTPTRLPGNSVGVIAEQAPGESWRICYFHNNLRFISRINSGKQNKDGRLTWRQLSKGPMTATTEH